MRTAKKKSDQSPHLKASQVELHFNVVSIELFGPGLSNWALIEYGTGLG